MSIIKEKKYIWIGVLLLINALLVLFVGIVGEKWDSHTSEIAKKKLDMMDTSSYEDIWDSYLISLQNAVITYAITGQKPSFDIDNPPQELIETIDNCKKGTLGVYQCFQKFQEYFGKQKNIAADQYNVYRSDWIVLQQNEPKIKGIKLSTLKMILYYLQGIILLLSMVFYIWLLESLGKKYYSKLERENKLLKEKLEED